MILIVIITILLSLRIFINKVLSLNCDLRRRNNFDLYCERFQELTPKLYYYTYFFSGISLQEFIEVILVLVFYLFNSTTNVHD